MATVTKNWSTGTGSFTIIYDGSGDGSIVVTSSDNNLHEARSMTITVKTIAGSPTVTKTVTVSQAMKPYIDLTNAIVTAATQTYTGSALTPTPTVTLNGETVPTTAYDVAYSNNVNAGTGTITITAKSGGDYTGSASGNFTINKATPTYTAPTKKTGLTYTGSAQNLLTAGSTNHGTIYYSSDGSTWSQSIPQATNANTTGYIVYWKLTGDSNHNDVASTTVSGIVIAKAAGVSGVSGRTLTYNRSAQNLVTVSGNTGTVHYRVGTSGSWSTSIPTATNASTLYTIQYYVDASTNYNAVGSSSSPQSVTTSIAKVTPVVSTAPSARTGLTYTGSVQNLLSGGSMKFSSSDSTSVAGTFTYAQGTNAGTYSSLTWLFTPTDTTNYNNVSGTVIGSVTIAQATGSVTTAPTAINPTYSGSSKYIVNAGSGTGTMYYRYRYKSYTASSWGSWSSYSTSRPSQTNAGYYEVSYYAAASSDGNYTQSATGTVSCEIYRASISPTVSMSGWTYGGTASNPSVSGNTGSGTVTYTYKKSTDPDSYYSSTKPSNAGTYTVKASIAATTNYNSATCTTNFTIARANRTLSFGSLNTTVRPSGNVTNTATPSAGSGDGAITYSLSSTTYATINSSTGKVTAKTSEGDVTVTATIAQGTNYNSASASYVLHVTSLYVDLGLPSGLMWATKNLDLSQSNGFTASEYQYNSTFFSWGNSTGYNASTPPASDITTIGSVNGAFTGVYDWGSSNDGPYASTPGAALTGNIPLTQDAARVTLGSPWRMPTNTEYQELFNSSYTKYIDSNGTEVTATNKMVTVNGVVGIYLQSKINGNRIFFPACGYGKNTAWGNRGRDGSYDSSVQANSSNRRYLYFWTSSVTPNYSYAKWEAHMIRPVR